MFAFLCVIAAIHMGFKAFCSQERLKPMCMAANNECSSEYSSEYRVLADRYMGFKALRRQERLKPMCRAANHECSSGYSSEYSVFADRGILV